MVLTYNGLQFNDTLAAGTLAIANIYIKIRNSSDDWICLLCTKQ